MKTLNEILVDFSDKLGYQPGDRASFAAFREAENNLIALRESELTLATREVKREIREKVESLRLYHVMYPDGSQDAPTISRADVLALLSTLDTSEEQK